jgi:hypothetical protein
LGSSPDETLEDAAARVFSALQRDLEDRNGDYSDLKNEMAFSEHDLEVWNYAVGQFRSSCECPMANNLEFRSEQIDSGYYLFERSHLPPFVVAPPATATWSPPPRIATWSLACVLPAP